LPSALIKYRARIVLISIFLLLIAAAGAFAGEKELINKIREIRKDRIAAQFIRSGRTTLKMAGYITKDTYNEYLKNIRPGIDTLVITSPGGDTNSGVKMGLDINKRGLTVIVEGLAASSAANYLFLGGAKKVLRNGFAGFHGNAQALLTQAGGFDRLKKEMKANNKISDAQFEEFKKELEETIRLEKVFYDKLGVSQELFDITQTNGKGVVKGPVRDFAFLLPSIGTMKKFGISNVSGEQDIGLAEKLGISVIYY
jgi:hypothetical protein